MFSDEELLRFNLTARQVQHFAGLVNRTAENLVRYEDNPDRDDVKQRMWIALLELKNDPPAGFPTDLPDQDSYCEVVMLNAARECVWRELPDGPMRGGRRQSERVVSRDE